MAGTPAKAGEDDELQPDEPAGTVHEGEFVIPTEAVEAIGLPTLERLRLMRKPDGGVMATMTPRAGAETERYPGARRDSTDMPRKRSRGLAHSRKLGRVMQGG